MKGSVSACLHFSKSPEIQHLGVIIFDVGSRRARCDKGLAAAYAIAMRQDGSDQYL